MSIELEHLTKLYDGAPVIDDVSLEIGAGELFVMLGPSGSGKTTLLRMIAGLAEVDAGTVRLHGRDVTRLSPKDRGIGFVFQNYALFGHMTVAENVEFALKVRRVPVAARRERREELLQLVGLAGLADRHPWQLSGGQQQRVAIARALAHQPGILLLDEPFGALDAKIRVELRESLRTIQRELGLTTVFVTHDQEEAFELADRLSVLRDGRLLEVGAPHELYLRPRSPFVATFLGAANLMVGESSPRGIRLGEIEFSLATEAAVARMPRRTQVLIRPEDVEVSPKEHGEHTRLGKGSVESVASIGGFERLRLRLPRPPGVRPVVPEAPLGADHLLFDALRPQHEALRFPLRIGDPAWIAVRRFHVLAATSLRLLVDSRDTEWAKAAAELGRSMAARSEVSAAPKEAVTVVAHDGPFGLDFDPVDAETERADEDFDVLVLGLDQPGLDGDLEGLLRMRHHVLFVAGPAPLPKRILVCVTPGEHGKVDVRFAERLAWQLGAAATILTVLPEDDGNVDVPRHVTRFLDASARAMSARGVTARTRVRRGRPIDQVVAEIDENGHDLLLLGAPPSTPWGGVETRSGLVPHFLENPPRCPFLLVRR